MRKYSLILEQLNAIQQKQCDYQVYTYKLKKTKMVRKMTRIWQLRSMKLDIGRT